MVRRARLAEDQRGAALGASAQIVDHPLRRAAALDEAHLHRGQHETVAQA